MTFLPSLLVSICRALHFFLHSLQNHGLHLLLHPSISHTQYLQRYFLAASSVARYSIPFDTSIASNNSHSSIVSVAQFLIYHILCRQHLILRNYLSHNFSSSLSLYSIFAFLRFFFSDLTLVLLSSLYSLLFVATLPVFQSSELFELQLSYSISQLFWFCLFASISA